MAHSSPMPDTVAARARAERPPALLEPRELTQYVRCDGELMVDIGYWSTRMADDGSAYLAPHHRWALIPAAHITQVIAALERVREQMIIDGVLEG